MIKQTLKNLYEAMLDIQSMELEQFRTKITEQDPKFQGVAIILNEGLYAFENLSFEEQIEQPQIQALSLSPETTTENTNDNQQTQSNQNTISTGTSGY